VRARVTATEASAATVIVVAGASHWARLPVTPSALGALLGPVVAVQASGQGQD
jgi:hypothetical protein